MDIVAAKTRQATALLDELGIDMWLVFVRETMMMADPVMPLVVGEHAVWQSFFVYTGSGKTAALVPTHTHRYHHIFNRWCGGCDNFVLVSPIPFFYSTAPFGNSRDRRVTIS